MATKPQNGKGDSHTRVNFKKYQEALYWKKLRKRKIKKDVDRG